VKVIDIAFEVLHLNTASYITIHSINMVCMFACCNSYSSKVIVIQMLTVVEALYAHTAVEMKMYQAVRAREQVVKIIAAPHPLCKWETMDILLKSSPWPSARETVITMTTAR